MVFPNLEPTLAYTLSDYEMTQGKTPGHDLPWAYRLRHSGPCEVVAVGGGQVTVVPCGELRSRSLPVAQARKIDYYMTSRKGGEGGKKSEAPTSSSVMRSHWEPVGPHMNETEVWPLLGWKDEETPEEEVSRTLARKRPRLEHTSRETRGD